MVRRVEPPNCGAVQTAVASPLAFDRASVRLYVPCGRFPLWFWCPPSSRTTLGSVPKFTFTPACGLPKSSSEWHVSVIWSFLTFGFMFGMRDSSSAFSPEGKT